MIEYKFIKYTDLSIFYSEKSDLIFNQIMILNVPIPTDFLPSYSNILSD